MSIAIPVVLTAKQCGGTGVVTATHTITFDDCREGGSTITTKTVKDGERTIMHLPEHRDEQGFLGWKLVKQDDSPESEEADYFDFENPIKADYKLYGWWKNEPDSEDCFVAEYIEGQGPYVKWNPEAPRPSYKNFNLVLPKKIKGKEGKYEDIIGISPEGFCDEDNHLELRSISLPDSIKVFSSKAFAYCSNLRIINFPKNLFSIHPFCFQYCSKLSNIVLNEGLERIEEDAFNCFDDDVDQFLKTITMPKSLKFIGQRAFHYSAIETLDMSKCGNVEIKPQAFHMCYYLQNVILPDELEYIPDECFAYDNSIRYLTIPKGIKSIGAYAFDTCSRIKEITIAEDSELMWIGEGAFYNCYSLEKINFPYKLKWIDSSALYGCDTLKNVSFANTDKKWIYAYGTSDQEILEPSVKDTYANALTLKKHTGNRWMSDPEKDETNNLVYLTDEENRCYIVGSTASTLPATLNIPVTITNSSGEYKVVGIAPKAFAANNDTTFENEVNVIFKDIGGSNYIEYISNNAFNGQKNIWKVNLEVCKNLKEIGEKAFYNCFNTNDFEIPKFTLNLSGCTELTYIGDYAFATQDSSIRSPDGTLQNVILPSSLTTLGEGCFKYNMNLESIIFPSNCKLSKINYYAHQSSYGANWMTDSIIRGTSVDNLDLSGCTELIFIAEGAFQDGSIKSVILPNGLKEIGPRSFSDNVSLKTINIPSSCLVIGANFLQGNTILEGVTFDDATSQWYIYDVESPVTYDVSGKTAAANATALRDTYPNVSWIKITE